MNTNQFSTPETINELTEDARKYMSAIGKKGGSASKGKPHAKERAKRAGTSGSSRRRKTSGGSGREA
jgi:general stress protein YciG